jgi:hypothetical protein
LTTKTLGDLSLAALAPGVAAANAQLGALLAAQATARAKLAAQLAVPVPTMPDPGTLAAAVLASLALYDPVASLAAIFSTRASLQLDLDAAGALTAAAAPVVASLGSALGVGGVGAYVFEGSAPSLGLELGAVVGSRIGAGDCKALALVTTDPAAWAALSALFRTS